MNQKCVEKYVSEIQKKRSLYPIRGKIVIKISFGVSSYLKEGILYWIISYIECVYF